MSNLPVMGQFTPPPATIDLVESYARRRGEQIELVLARPTMRITKQQPTIRLLKGKRTVETAVEIVGAGDARRLVARVPQEQLGDGIWALELRPGTGPEPLEARLLVQGARPVVLLMGGTASTSRLPDRRPRPAALSTSRGTTGRSSLRSRAEQVGRTAARRAVGALRRLNS